MSSFSKGEIPNASQPIRLDLEALEEAIGAELEDETFISDTTYDALNRPATVTTPHTQEMPCNTIRPTYNEANLLEKMDANLRGAKDAYGNPVWTPFVTNIDYDAKGQRERIDYGTSGPRVTTTYTYDPLTFRLMNLKTIRGASDTLQDLFYTYDPVGNITHIRDDAQQTIYHANTKVEPNND